eukprot:979256_1
MDNINFYDIANYKSRLILSFANIPQLFIRIKGVGNGIDCYIAKYPIADAIMPLIQTSDGVVLVFVMGGLLATFLSFILYGIWRVFLICLLRTTGTRVTGIVLDLGMKTKQHQTEDGDWTEKN